MIEASATGLKIRITAIPTFPTGFDITQFADEADALSIGDVPVAETGVSLNGDLVSWSVPGKIPASISVLTNTKECDNLETIWMTNRMSASKIATKDTITMVVSYPNGTTRVLSNGVMTSGTPMPTATAGGRLSTRTFTFDFELLV